MQRIIILGAGYAGLMTALRLQPAIKRNQIEVTLINARETFIERIRLHQQVMGNIPSQLHLPTFLKGTRINFLCETITSINPEASTISTQTQTMHYDSLVVALGSHVNRDAIAGIREYAHTLDSHFINGLQKRVTSGGKLLVIGGGLTGIEVASELTTLTNLDIHLMSHGTIGDGLSAKAQKYIYNSLERKGVTLHTHTSAQEIYHDYVATNEGDIDFDICLWAGGFQASPLIASAGFTTNQQGQMLLDNTLKSVDYDNIYGIGDVGFITMQNGTTPDMGCAVAMPMGIHVADTIKQVVAGNTPKSFEFGTVIKCISLGRNDGLIQFTQPSGHPTSRIIKGWSGAIVKELVCRYTIFSLHTEKYLPGSYRYPKGQIAQSASIPIHQMEAQIL